MIDLDMKVKKYSKSIGYTEITDALNVYKETRNKEIRNNIINRYYGNIKKYIDCLDTNLDKEDLLQGSLEILINHIDNFGDAKIFLAVLRRKIDYYIYFTCVDKLTYVSLDTMDIQCNNNYEDIVLQSVENEYLINDIVKELDVFSNTRYALVFKDYYGIGTKRLGNSEIAKKYKMSGSAIKLTVYRVLTHLYFKLQNKYNYKPGRKVNNALNYEPVVIRYPSQVSILERKLDNSELESYRLVNNYDSINNAHMKTRLK